jgi:transposase
LLDEAIDADSAAIEDEIDGAQGEPAARDKRQAQRQPRPAHLLRREVRHEPTDTNCRCGCAMKRISEDIAEKLDYVPGVFTVERHVRGKWVCVRSHDNTAIAPVTSMPMAAIFVIGQRLIGLKS